MSHSSLAAPIIISWGRRGTNDLLNAMNDKTIVAQATLVGGPAHAKRRHLATQMPQARHFKCVEGASPGRYRGAVWRIIGGGIFIQLPKVLFLVGPHFQGLACFDQFSKICFVGPHLCWLRSTSHLRLGPPGIWEQCLSSNSWFKGYCC